MYPTGRSVFDSFYQGARQGAADGALTGLFIVSQLLAVKGSSNVAEITYRALGREPQWPVFAEDCELVKFKSWTKCNNEYNNDGVLDNFSTYAVYIVGVSTLVGMAFGGVCSAAKKVLEKPTSHKS